MANQKYELTEAQREKLKVFMEKVHEAIRKYKEKQAKAE